MPTLSERIDTLAAEHDFAGVVSVDTGGDVEFAKAYGLAHRGYQVPNTVDTRFGMASGSKGFTALAVVSLIEQGAVSLSTTARSVLGTDLPLVDDAVTIEHLLGHRSGIGDYLDEEVGYEITDYVLSVPVHELATTEPFVPMLDGHPAKFGPGERFSYCNSGYVLLALIAERVSGTGYHDLVHDRVCVPAGLTDTRFPRSDELPERTATGYLPLDGVSRTNVFHLPVRATGDGGAYTTVADMSTFWRALFAGKIVASRWVAEMVRPHSDVPEEGKRYGLGFWLDATTDAVSLVGFDAGVSFSSTYDPGSDRTRTVISNSSYGAWPIAKDLAART